MEKPVQPEQPASKPTQETPKGYAIPVPSKNAVMRFFEKATKPKPSKG
jgi:hypothetical protein